MINASVFKAYDVRAIYPTELNEDIAYKIGRAYVAYLNVTRIAVSRDMRVSSPTIAAAFIDGARFQGADVVDFDELFERRHVAVHREQRIAAQLVKARDRLRQVFPVLLILGSCVGILPGLTAYRTDVAQSLSE